MKRKLEFPAKNHKHITQLFTAVITYRIPLPVIKVIIYADNITYPICPRCSLSLDREYMPFCDRCGQKLNWDFFEHAKICHPHVRRN